MTRPCSLLACCVSVAIDAGEDARSVDEVGVGAGLWVEQPASTAARVTAIPQIAAFPDLRMCASYRYSNLAIASAAEPSGIGTPRLCGNIYAIAKLVKTVSKRTRRPFVHRMAFV